jgi:hypothetical protein
MGISPIDNPPFLYDQVDVTKSLYVRNRIAIEKDQVGEFPGFNRPHAVADAKRGRRVGRGHPQGELASLSVSTLAAGSHLTALATATWLATAHSQSNRTLRQAITVASIAYAGLVCLLPLRQIVSYAGWNCSTPPVLIPFVPLLVGWVIYAAVGRTRGDL